MSVASCANSDVQLVVSEMKSFINDLDTAYTGSAADNDLTAFWHRKTGKPVLGINLLSIVNIINNIFLQLKRFCLHESLVRTLSFIEVNIKIFYTAAKRIFRLEHGSEYADRISLR